jgi:hypothetical protein
MYFKIRKNNRVNIPEVLALRIFLNLFFLKQPVFEMELRAFITSSEMLFKEYYELACRPIVS